MWNSGMAMSNWGAGSREGSSYGPGPGSKRPYNDSFSEPMGGDFDDFGPSASSYSRSDYGNEDYGYGGPWQDYDKSYGGDSYGGSQDSRNDDGMLSSMGLPTSFTASIDTSEDFANDIPLEGKGRSSYQNPFASPAPYRGGRGGGGAGSGGKGRGGGRGQNKRGQAGRGGGGGFNRGGGQRGGRGGFGGDGGGRGGGGGYNQWDGNQRGGRGGGGRGRGNMHKKPGLPPQKVFGGGGGGNRGGKQQRGKGRGGNFGGAMAPVHSLSKVATQQFDAASMSTAEKIHRFALFVQGEPMKVNAIQTIENAVHGTKLNIKTQYEVEELMRISGKWMFTGRLILGGIFLARCVGANKKEVKHETYHKALDVLKTKTVAEIFNLTDPGAEAIRKELATTLDTTKDASKQADTILQKQTEKAVNLKTNHEGFICLIEYLKNTQGLPENKISCMEQSMSASHCGLSHKYDFRASRLPSGRFFFHGILMVGDVTIAVGKGHKKKDAKVNTYEEAYKNLTNKPLQEVMKGLDVEEECKVEEDQGQGGSAMIVDGKKLSVPEKLDRMCQRLKDSTYKENNINTVDACATNLGLIKTCIYRSLTWEDDVVQRIACDLYLERYLIATGEGEKRKLAQIDAYNNAWEVLITTTGEHIVKNHKAFVENDMDPSIIDVHVKGHNKPHGESNLAGLKKHNHDYEDESKTVNKLVILEHEDWTKDRKRQAFCILTYSATCNGMLLEWKTSQDGNMYKSVLSLQKQQIGEACALGKNNARNLAAADALFRLYETQDVIKIIRRDDSKLWIPYADIQKKAAILKEKGDTEEPEFAERVDDEGNPIPISPDADKWALKVAEEIINEYKDQFTLEELIFGPGMPLCESKEIRSMGKARQLRHDIRQLESQSYLVIQHKMEPQNMARCVHENGGVSGKYHLVDRSALPKYEEIQEELDKQLTLSGRFAGTKSKDPKPPQPNLQGFKPKFLEEEESEIHTTNKLY